MNSFFILLGFLGFALLGYLSLVRLLYKIEMPATQIRLKSVFNTKTLGSVSQSAVFIGLPSFAILLFWGWGPALLWVVTAHLMIETGGNLISAGMHQQVDMERHFSDFEAFDGATRSTILRVILLSLVTLVLVLLARLIDNQTGLLFALTSILISIQLLRSATSAVDAVIKLVSSIGLLLLGILLAQTMGIAVFGQLELAADGYEWLRVDNKTLLLVLLIVAGIQLGRNHSLRGGLNRLVGVLILVLITVLMVQIVWQQPSLDAPTLSSAERDPNLPGFGSVFLILSPALLLLLMQLIRRDDTQQNAGEHADEENGEVKLFLHRQSVSLVALAFSLIVLVALATANGIGAWNTHFVNWRLSLGLESLFDLTVRSVTAVSGVAALDNATVSTIFVITICLFLTTTLVFLMRRIARNAELASAEAISTETQQSPNLLARLWSHVVPQMIVVFLCASWVLANGFGIQLWVWTMSLCWVLCSDVMLDYASDMETANASDHFKRGFAMALFSVGALQLLWAGVSAFLSGDTLFAVALLLSLSIGLLLGWKNAVICIQGLQLRSDAKLFEGG